MVVTEPAVVPLPAPDDIVALEPAGIGAIVAFADTVPFEPLTVPVTVTAGAADGTLTATEPLETSPGIADDVGAGIADPVVTVADGIELDIFWAGAVDIPVNGGPVPFATGIVVTRVGGLTTLTTEIGWTAGVVIDWAIDGRAGAIDVDIAATDDIIALAAAIGLTCPEIIVESVIEEKLL